MIKLSAKVALVGFQTHFFQKSNFIWSVLFSKAVLFFFIFFVICLCHTVMSVSCSLMITCCERTDLLALLYVTFSCVLSLSHTVLAVVLDCINS